MADARELRHVLTQANEIATAVGHPVTSAHLLLAIFATPCAAGELLAERGVDDEAVLSRLTKAPKEAPEIRDEILARTREIAEGLAAPADSLHLLVALGRSRKSLGYELLEACGVPVAALRNTILSWYTGGARKPRHVPQVKARPSVPAPVAPRRPKSPRELRDDEILPGVPTRGAPPREPKPAPPLPPPPDEPALVDETPEPVARAPVAEPKPPAEAPLPFDAPDVELDGLAFPVLSALGRNLTAEAAAGRLDPLIGREREVEELVDILGKRRGNNPVLVGDPGVGKTAVVEGAAARLLSSTRPGEAPRLIVELELGTLLAGTSLRGAFSERIGAIKDEVRRAGGRVIVFLDELHTLIGAGATGDGPHDAANELKTALARGEFPCIGATTHDEYRKYVQSDPALERRFTAVHVDEPSVAETAAILAGLAPRYEAHHQIRYESGVLEAAARLAHRHVRERQLPDKAIHVIDLAGSRARRMGMPKVDLRQVAEVVAKLANLPIDRVLLRDEERLLRLEDELRARVIGHEEVVERVARALRRGHAGFAGSRPIASFLFLGPTGVGKTELAKAIAEVLGGGDDCLVRVDMSELSEAHAVSRLVGAPPGYVGHGEGGQLTEAVRRRPASVILLDEIEKAHREVLLLLLQVLDEGRLRDSQGRLVDFTQATLVLTSNLGAEAFAAKRQSARLGFGAASEQEDESSRHEEALRQARAALPPELWNRIEERCVFAPLGREEMALIARLLLEKSASRLQKERGIELRFDDALIDHLLESGGFEPSLGARPMRQAVQRLVEGPIAEALLRGEARAGATLHATVVEGRLRLR